MIDEEISIRHAMHTGADGRAPHVGGNEERDIYPTPVEPATSAWEGGILLPLFKAQVYTLYGVQGMAFSKVGTALSLSRPIPSDGEGLDRTSCCHPAG